MALSVFLDLLNGWSIPSIFLLWLIKNTKLQTTSIVVKVGKGQPWMLFGLFPEGFYWRRVFTIFSSLSNIIHTHIPANSIYLSSSNNLVMVQCLIHVFFLLDCTKLYYANEHDFYFPFANRNFSSSVIFMWKPFPERILFHQQRFDEFFREIFFFFKAILKKKKSVWQYSTYIISFQNSFWWE